MNNLTDINRKVAQAIDANGDQPWVWKYTECPECYGGGWCGTDMDGHYKCEYDHSKLPIPLPFSTSPEAFGVLIKWLHANSYTVKIYGSGIEIYKLESDKPCPVGTVNFNGLEFDKDDIYAGVCLAFLQAGGERC